MANPRTIRVHGLREMSLAFSKADKDLKKNLRSTLREVAEPVRSDAEALASSQITNIGDRWSQMRTGVTSKVVYVAPRQRGRRGGHRRPNLANLLMDRAMAPALEANAGEIEDACEDMLDKIARDWGR